AEGRSPRNVLLPGHRVRSPGRSGVNPSLLARAPTQHGLPDDVVHAARRRRRSGVSALHRLSNGHLPDHLQPLEGGGVKTAVKTLTPETLISTGRLTSRRSTARSSGSCSLAACVDRTGYTRNRKEKTPTRATAMRETLREKACARRAHHTSASRRRPCREPWGSEPPRWGGASHPRAPSTGLPGVDPDPA